MLNCIIAISGGIAAYKVCEVISTLFKQGVNLRVILTDSAQEFITPLTVATLSRHRAYTDQDFWTSTNDRPLHIALGEWADLIVIAPLTANTLGKLVYGLADNLLTNTILASKCPILLAPAMNTEMWEQKSVQRNWQLIKEDQRYHSIGPGSGLLACDRVGDGRMAEPSQIVTYITSLLHTGGKRDLAGKRVLISGGGTREFLDPVRFIGNPATGKMGLALASAGVTRGGDVTLIYGSKPTLADQPYFNMIEVTTAAEMESAMLDRFDDADIIIMAAAVADVKPAVYHQQKLAKQQLTNNLPLVQVPDIVANLGAKKQPHQILIGFAAQTGDIITPALAKLERKKLDGIVTNPIDLPDSGFGSDRNQAIFINSKKQQFSIPNCSKLIMAQHIFDLINSLA